MTQKNNGLIAAATESAPQENADENHINSVKGNQQKQLNVIYLPSGYLSPKDNINGVVNPINFGNKEYLYDADNLSGTALKKKYPLTYNRWRNMKQRAKKGKVVHKDFANFPDFLRIMEPCENKNYTLDRLDNSDPEYAPGKVEWRDKYAQNSNKSNNVYLTHDDGRCLTIAQWAAITDQKPTTLYKRREYGWTDMEIITGKREGVQLSVVDNPFPFKYRNDWEGAYLESVGCGYTGTRLDFLNEKCTELTAICREKAIELDNQIVYLPEGEERTNLQTELEDANDRYQKYVKVIRETQLQIDYELKKQNYLSGGSTTEMRKQMAKHFEKMVPRPNYTVNTPNV